MSKGICRVGVDFVGDPTVHGDLLGLGGADVYINGSVVAVVDDNVKPHKPFSGKHNNAKNQSGSPTVFVNNKAVFRLGDPAECGHVSTTASDDVLVD